MTRRQIVYTSLGLYLLLLIVVAVLFGSGTRNDTFEPQAEFELETWIALPGPMDINKGVFYLFLATILTIGTMLYVANRMQAKPNRVQTAVEALYALMRDQITRGSMDDRMARKWFPFIGTLFLFILFNNLIGYIPLPTNTHEKISIFGAEIPAFAIYAATANVSIPLVLALIVFISYNVEGIRAKGPLGYLKSLVPRGRPGRHGRLHLRARVHVELHAARQPHRSSLRQHPRRPPDHPVHVGRPGCPARPRGRRRLTLPIGVAIFIFEVGLVAALQAFIFATLSAIYLGGAVAEGH